MNVKAKTLLASAVMLLIAMGMFIWRVRMHRNEATSASSICLTGEAWAPPAVVSDLLDTISSNGLPSREYSTKYSELLGIVSEITDPEEKASVARECARRFLTFRLDGRTQDEVLFLIGNYERYISDFDAILQRSGVSVVERTDFFFAALAVLREYCCRPIPDEGNITDWDVWRRWSGTTYEARSLLLEELVIMGRWPLFGLVEALGDRERQAVVVRFVEFYKDSIKEVEKMDAYQRKRLRPRPHSRMISSGSTSYRIPPRVRTPMTIYIGDNEIDIKKWESGEKEKIIADILSKNKKVKGTPKLTTEDVEIKVDGID